jgi:hypothetical protein
MPPRQFVQVAAGDELGLGKADLAQQVDRASARLLLRAAVVAADGFCNLPADAEGRSEAHRRLLRDECDFLAADAVQLVLRQGGQVAAVVEDAAALDLSAAGEEA